MQATEKMLPWMFAYDRPNYARFLTYYWVTMQKLPEHIQQSTKNLWREIFLCAGSMGYLTRFHLTRQ